MCQCNNPNCQVRTVEESQEALDRALDRLSVLRIVWQESLAVNETQRAIAEQAVNTFGEDSEQALHERQVALNLYTMHQALVKRYKLAYAHMEILANINAADFALASVMYPGNHK